MKLFLPLLISFALLGQPAFAQRSAADDAAFWAEVAPLCRMVEASAQQHDLPVPFFARLIWIESAFQADVISPAGALGVAQFMPGTARERGVADPFEPQLALAKSAEYLAALTNQFGNLGLAAAAYNGGPSRVAQWLEGQGDLAAETRSYVWMITGRPVEDWAAAARKQRAVPPVLAEVSDQSCLQQVKSLSVQGRPRFPPRWVPLVPPLEARLAAYLEKALAQQGGQPGAQPGVTEAQAAAAAPPPSAGPEAPPPITEAAGDGSALPQGYPDP